MARFFGEVGYSEMVKTRPGVHEEKATVRKYKGDVIRKKTNWQKGEGLNDNLNVNHSISIVADEYAYAHCSAIRYVKWMGSCWKVTDVDIQRPRLILSIGGLYNANRD